MAFFLAGIVLVGGLVYLILRGPRGAHLQLQGSVLKMRSGQLDEKSSAAVLDFRVQNVSDVPFVVRTVTVTLEKADGATADGMLVAKSDLQQLLAYNKFLGSQYSPALSVKDQIAPHAQVDRMVAVRFEEPLAALERAKGVR